MRMVFRVSRHRTSLWPRPRRPHRLPAPRYRASQIRQAALRSWRTPVAVIHLMRKYRETGSANEDSKLPALSRDISRSAVGLLSYVIELAPKKLVRSRGLEPPRCYPLPPQGSASTNSATTAMLAPDRRSGWRRERASSNRSNRGPQGPQPAVNSLASRAGRQWASG